MNIVVVQGILGQLNYSVWYCNGGYMTFYICQNPLQCTTQRGKAKANWTLVSSNVSILVHKLLQINYTNRECQ